MAGLEVADVPCPETLVDGVVALRPFVPARDFGVSRAFYKDVGFDEKMLGDEMAEMRLGAFSFLLQDFYVPDWAANCVMHMLVRDVHAWWRHLEASSLPARYDVQAPRPPKLEPWGLEVVYLFDPCGVLWQFAAMPDRR